METRVIEKVTRSDWAAPIVAIPKSDGTETVEEKASQWC